MKAKTRQHVGFGAIVTGLLLLTWLAWPTERSQPASADTRAKVQQVAVAKTVAPPPAAPAAEPPAATAAPAPAAEPATETALADDEAGLDVKALASASSRPTGDRTPTDDVEDHDADVRQLAEASPGLTDTLLAAADTEVKELAQPAPRPADRRADADRAALPALEATRTPEKSADKKPGGPASTVGNELSWPRIEALSREQASEHLKQGLALAFGSDGALDKDKGPHYVKARALISAAYAAGALGEAESEKARLAAQALADATIFSRWVYEGDPLTILHTFEAGDWLDGIRKVKGQDQHGLIRRMNLRVPARVILAANRVPSGRDFRAGEKYKLIRGPFHCIISKKKFTMDVYLQDTFVKQFKVAIGAAESPTPEGFFHVVLNGKTLMSTYYPPPNRSAKALALRPGDKDYPLDPEGHNIRIEGVPAKGTNISAEEGFAIHGTKDPSSIGKSISLGCVRVSPTDIKEVYGMLYEKWSTVQIKP